MTTPETTTDRTTLRPVYGNPDVHHPYADDGDCETPIDPRVGWSLSYGCKVTAGYDADGLHVTVSTSDRDQRDGITKRAVTREQVADYARKLAALVGVDASEVERLREQLADAVQMVKQCLGHPDQEPPQTPSHFAMIQEARAEVERLTAENAELRRDVQLAEEAQSNAELELHRDHSEATGVSP